MAEIIKGSFREPTHQEVIVDELQKNTYDSLIVIATRDGEWDFMLGGEDSFDEIIKKLEITKMDIHAMSLFGGEDE